MIINNPNHRTHSRSKLLWLGACCALAATALAQEPVRERPGTNRDVTPSNRDASDPDRTAAPVYPRQNGVSVTMKPSHGDKNFLEEATQSAREEVAISQIAVTKASHPQVREFAQMMVSDHEGAGTALSSLVTVRGVAVDAKRVNVQRWEKKSAKEFDKDYMEKMVDDHEKAVKLYEKQSTKGEDPELMAFASKTLPTLQTHLAKAREIHKTVK